MKSNLSGKTLILVDQFTYLSSNISSTESDIKIHLLKIWNAFDRLLIIWKSDLSDKINWDFFQALAVSVLLYECTPWTLTKSIEKKLDGNFTRILYAVLNKF